MHWPPSHDDRAAWSAVGGVVTAVAVTLGVASVWWPVVVVLAIIGVCLMLAPLLRLGPWHQIDQLSPHPGITAGHGIKAGGNIETDGTIEAGHGVEAGGHIRSSTKSDSLLFAATERRVTSLRPLGIVNPLVSKLLIRQYASPLEHDEPGCVIRVAIAGDCQPSGHELSSTTKGLLKDALDRSGIEKWVQTNGWQTGPVADWRHASPNTGLIVTFKRDWGRLGSTGSALTGRATLQITPGLMLGPRVILVFDLIEQNADPNKGLPRLQLSLFDIYSLLHTLSKTVIDDLASAVFPPIYKDAVPPIVGPNYEIQFGDRTLDKLCSDPG